MLQASSQDMCARSSKIRISSATLSAGWVSFICTAALSGSADQFRLPLEKKRAQISCSEQLTKKYYCKKHNTRPASVEPSGESTRVTESAAISSSTAPAKSPCENS